MSPLHRVISLLVLALPVPAFALTTQHFESGHVHPVEMSPDGTTLFVVHTAGHELAVFDLTGPAPVLTGKVPVGYEPVTVRARTDDEVWVVSFVSDAVNVVDVPNMRVKATLLPGDEPTDVMFSEPNGRAFVSVAEENKVAVFDLSDLTAPPTDIPLTHCDPRSLALSPDGSTLYVAALDSQNETTVVDWHTVQANGGRPAPNPPMDPGLPAEPKTALIVKYDGSNWVDETSTSWPVPYTLLDHDVIEISTSSLAVTGHYRGVGTALFNLAVNPVTGVVYVTNQEAFNEVRFDDNHQGKFAQSRITLIDPGPRTVTPVHLNQHINYANPAGDPTERSLSLGLPMDLAVSSTGSEIYVAAMGSRNVGVLDAAGNVTRRITVGEGPTGLALDEDRNKLYVVNRFASDLSVVDLTDDSSFRLPLGFDPTGNIILAGREFLYDTTDLSAHGDLACATCHLFGGNDNIAWELGSPLGTFESSGVSGGSGFHPMKGPMVTQTLKGLTNNAPFHWRGDRALSEFNDAFVDLMGRGSTIAPSLMTDFENFMTSMIQPPHPNRQLDGSFPSSMPNGGDPANGETLFLTGGLAPNGPNQECVDCHHLPTGARGTITADSDLEGNQDMVIPHLRDLYRKTDFDPETGGTNLRGFGYLHDGAFGSPFRFFQDHTFFSFANDSDRRDVEAFVLAFGSDVPACLGAQVTINSAVTSSRLNTLIAQSASGNVDLIAKGPDGSGQNRGWVRVSGGWSSDRSSEPTVGLASIVANAAPGAEITFTAVMTGEGVRLGVDRDGDGFRDRDELDIGSDPDDPGSTPNSIVGAPLAVTREDRMLWLLGANPTRTGTTIGFQMPYDGPASLEVYDVRGRHVRTLVRSPRHEAGRAESTWNLLDAAGRRVAAGVYFVRLRTPMGTARERVVVIR